jgi:hypothetical protein
MMMSAIPVWERRRYEGKTEQCQRRDDESGEQGFGRVPSVGEPALNGACGDSPDTECHRAHDRVGGAPPLSSEQRRKPADQHIQDESNEEVHEPEQECRGTKAFREDIFKAVFPKRSFMMRELIELDIRAYTSKDGSERWMPRILREQERRRF